MAVDKVVSGVEETELNGPFKPPLWDGSDGTRVGQQAFDAAAALFTPAGPVYWNGTAWVQFGSSGSINIGNSDLTLTSNRILSGDAVNNYDFELNNLGSFIVSVPVTGAGTMQLINEGSTVVQSASTMVIESTGNNVTLIAPMSQVILQAPEVVVTSLLSGDPDNKKFVMSDNSGILSAEGIGAVINVPYTSAVTSDDLLTNSFLNSLYPSASIGTQRVFTNITDAPGNTALALMYAAASWSVKIDFIKCS